MIPAKITDEIFNSLTWESKSPENLDKELEGYTVLGVETCAAWYINGQTEAADGVILYLQKPNENRIKLVSLDADFIYKSKKEQANASPISIAVAHVEGQECAKVPA